MQLCEEFRADQGVKCCGDYEKLWYARECRFTVFFSRVLGRLHFGTFVLSFLPSNVAMKF